MELQKAIQIADAILFDIMEMCKVEKVEDLGDRVKVTYAANIAGSIRRQKPDVKDIEIVCLPSPGNRYKLGMYFNNQGHYIVKGNFHGRYVQMVLKDKGIKLDLFMPQESDYYRMLAIRTGPAETYSHKVLATTWRKMGWVGTDDGLRLCSECVEKGSKWICVKAQPTLPPVWKSEQEFIEWLGLEYLHPKDRK